jgi:hypothetical protein
MPGRPALVKGADWPFGFVLWPRPAGGECRTGSQDHAATLGRGGGAAANGAGGKAPVKGRHRGASTQHTHDDGQSLQYDDKKSEKRNQV